MTKLEELIQKLNEASYAYYALDKPIMSDKAYDALYDELAELEKKTGIILAGSPTQKVQGYVINGFQKVTHSKPMLSAQKTKDVNEIKKYLKDKGKWYCSGKLDGCTLVLRYSDGKFVQGITRGNGTIGEDVTDACRFISNLPMVIPYQDDLELRGECVMSWDEFNRINETLADKYSHPRNLASGTLRQLDLNVVKERKLSFVVFECVTDTGEDSKFKCLSWLSDFGFETVLRVELHEGNDNVVTVTDLMTKYVKADSYPYDGLIFEIDSKDASKKLGATAHHEGSRMALKWADSTYETVLRDVEWNVGKTGVLFPTGIVDPVDLDGAITERVTLNNVTYIKNMELGIGDTVTIYRSNMVIPTLDDNLTRSGTLEIPSTCPICGSLTKVVKQNASEVLYCTNPHCKGKLLGLLTHFVSKAGLDIKGLSEQTLELLIKIGAVNNFSDILSLRNWRDKLVRLPGLGEKSVDKLLKSIDDACTNTDPAHFISALSIPGIGLAQAKIIVKKFKTIDEFVKSAPTYNFTYLEGFGDVLQNNIRSWFSDEANLRELSILCDGIRFSGTESLDSNNNSIQSNGKLAGKTICVTGNVHIFKNRKELTDKAEACGAKISSSVSKNTDYLINNDVTSSSSKNTKAKALNVPIITEEQFVEMIGE